MYEYFAELRRVVDGDTVDVTIDCGFNMHVKERVRLKGINTLDKKGKFGRLLGELVSPDEKENANSMLLNEGHATEYHGGKR